MFLEATEVGVPFGFALSPMKEVQLQLGSMEVGLDLCFGVSLGGGTLDCVVGIFIVNGAALQS